MPACPVCGFHDAKIGPANADIQVYVCPHCGQFGLPRMLMATFELPSPLKPGSIEAAALSHIIRKMQQTNVAGELEWPSFTLDEIKQIIATARLPTPAEQADNLVIWLGDYLKDAGPPVPITFDEFKSKIGSSSEAGVAFIVRSLHEKGLIDCGGQTYEQLRHVRGTSVTLSMDGWQRYEALKRGRSDSTKAFMAMKFGDPVLDAVYRDCLKPAVAQTGFDLLRLDEKPRAGLIDDRLRVEIRSSRFVIADLTHSNLGAYWEAGYAEGLGKPVIYTCEKSVFEKEKTHFDTNHHLTVPWEQANLADAAQRLKSTIRATLPAEAKPND